MAYEFHLPDIGEGLVEAVVVRWLVPVGGTVGLDEPMVEMETDKAVTEIPAPRAGVILHHGAAEGETIEVDALLVVIGDEGETWSTAAPPVEVAIEPARPAGPKRAAEAAPIVGTLDEGSGFRRQALPAVRKRAEELGVDLATVTGTGPGGRITRNDVEAAAATSGPSERVRMSPTRLAIARNLTRSWQEIPHVWTYGDAAAGPLLEKRTALALPGIPLPIEALLIEAVVPLLAGFPEFNATVDGDAIVYRRHYDVGVAVDTPDGLMVAVVREADTKDAHDLAADIVRLAGAAKDRSIAAADLRGQTFTISNIGAVGGGYGTPIVPYGTTAILSVGRAEEQAVARNGEILAERRFPLTLAYDHRAIDGALGRRFLAAVISALESA
ncbi:MAG TPA: dihydrolipoamide acetyltransferase family protein [Acidimicrobiia bacterium]|nr:dihydrolipoamide acetyltransferase family protein [Acidimicrobiia bacterium]